MIANSQDLLVPYLGASSISHCLSVLKLHVQLYSEKGISPPRPQTQRPNVRFGRNNAQLVTCRSGNSLTFQHAMILLPNKLSHTGTFYPAKRIER